MKIEEKDRRVRRTRQLLHQALMSLILEKPYHAISVQDILDRADVGRSTFYAHFQDKDNLFRYGFERMLDALAQHIDAHEQEATDSHYFPSLALFQHVQENQQLFKALIGGQGIELLLKHGQNALSQRIENHLERHVREGREVSIPLPVLSYYLAGSLITLLKWWLDNRMSYTPERMDEIYQQLALPGVLQVIG
jgi:AcrR family transcriptional regulator